MCSMISGQCDKLRELAIRANELYEYEMERELDQAADLILELRDDLQRVNAENAKLREACAELLEMAESNDPEWLHWPEMYEELRKLGVEL